MTAHTHTLLVVGEGPFYLVSLPASSRRDRHQVVVRATLDDDTVGRLRGFQAHFGFEVPFTLHCAPFELSALLEADAAGRELTADLYRGRARHGGQLIAGDLAVRVEEVLYAAAVPEEPSTGPGDQLLYLPFGDADRELFLAHLANGTPSFDQVLKVAVTGATFTSAELEREGRPTVTVPSRPDLPAQRLGQGETAAAHSSAGQHSHHDLQVEVLAELVFAEPSV